MKQPRSSSNSIPRVLARKTQLPSFRVAKTSTTRLQEVFANSKSELWFNNRLLPLQVQADRKNGDILKLLFGTNEVTILEGSRTCRHTWEQQPGKQWVEVSLGEVFVSIKVRKIGDQNAFGSHNNLIAWERSQNFEKKIGATVNVKEALKNINSQRKTDIIFPGANKEDKTKQMKAFVNNMMGKKMARRLTEKPEQPTRISTKKSSCLLKNKMVLPDEDNRQISNTWVLNVPSTACSGASGISGLRSLRKDIVQRNRLRESKFTGKSEKQTSVGDQSVFLHPKLGNPVTTTLTQQSHVNDQEISRKKIKFDSQPYFYQNSTVTSQFSSNKQTASQKYNSFSRQQCGATVSQVTSKCLQQPPAEDAVMQQLMDKSEHKSEDQVQQQIDRSAMANSSIVKHQQETKQNQKRVRQEESSQCFESKHLESSEGTIYESKYE